MRKGSDPQALNFLTLSSSLSLSHTHSLSLPPSLPLFLSLSLSLSLSLRHTHTLSLSLSRSTPNDERGCQEGLELYLLLALGRSGSNQSWGVRHLPLMPGEYVALAEGYAQAPASV